MKVGAYLLEKHNFGDPEVKARFLDQFGYSETVLEKILQDTYPVLLGCHIHDLSIFTGEDVDFLHSLEGYKSLIPDDLLYKGPAYVAPVEELEQTFSIGNPPKQPGVFIELNLNNDKPVELVPVTPEGIMRYEQVMNRLRRSMEENLSINPDNDPELDALYERVKQRANGKHFKVITPKALQPGDAINKDPAEIDYLITTYPITGIESVKIVKGRELGIGTGDKFVFANQMRSTINKLGLSNPPPEEVDVLLGNSRIAALMEDPEFRKEWEGVVGEQLVELAKRQLKKGLLDTEGIDIYTQPTLRQGETKITTEESAPKEVLVPVGLLRELANIAIDNGYPCAEEAFQLLTKNK